MGLGTSVVDWLRDRAASVGQWRARRGRRREAGVDVGDKVRDSYTDELLEVVAISPKRAHEYYRDGRPLAEYGANPTVASPDDVVLECRYPGGEETYAYPAGRITPLEVSPGDVVRDRFTGEKYTVERVRDELARTVEVDDELLYKRGRNEDVDCRTDWVVDCAVPGSEGTEPFPLTRLVPGPSPDRPADARDELKRTTTCFSCADGVTGTPEDAACESCERRIKTRDGYVCQQCGSTADLEIHHLYYGTNVVGEIPDRYLVTLCPSCHDDRHRADPARDQAAGQASG